MRARPLLEVAAAEHRVDQVVRGVVALMGPPGKPVEGFKKLLKELGQFIDHVIALEGNDTVLVERLSSRRTCSDCGKIINLIFSPPKVSGQCDDCDGELFQRNDDKPEVIQKRLDVYEEQTKPLVNYYERKALLRRVDGVGSVHEVAERIDKYLTNNILEK